MRPGMWAELQQEEEGRAGWALPFKVVGSQRRFKQRTMAGVPNTILCSAPCWQGYKKADMYPGVSQPRGKHWAETAGSWPHATDSPPRGYTGQAVSSSNEL